MPFTFTVVPVYRSLHCDFTVPRYVYHTVLLRTVYVTFCCGRAPLRLLRLRLILTGLPFVILHAGYVLPLILQFYRFLPFACCCCCYVYTLRCYVHAFTTHYVWFVVAFTVTLRCVYVLRLRCVCCSLRTRLIYRSRVDCRFADTARCYTLHVPAFTTFALITAHYVDSLLIPVTTHRFTVTLRIPVTFTARCVPFRLISHVVTLQLHVYDAFALIRYVPVR